MDYKILQTRVYIRRSGFSSMRRGFNSLVTSIDSALTRDDTRSDAASTASSDSDRYVVVGLAAESPDDADMAFRYVTSFNI